MVAASDNKPFGANHVARAVIAQQKTICLKCMSLWVQGLAREETQLLYYFTTFMDCMLFHKTYMLDVRVSITGSKLLILTLTSSATTDKSHASYTLWHE